MNTFADYINGGDVRAAVTEQLEDINKACREHPDNPRDSGVSNAKAFIDDPLRLVSLDLEDSEIGIATVSGGGTTVTLDFDADEDVSEWVSMNLLELFPA